MPHSRRPYLKSALLLFAFLLSLLALSRILIGRSTLIGNHLISVVGLSRVSPGSQASFLVRVTDRNKIPLAGAAVTMELSDESASFFSRPRLLGTSRTDSTGCAIVNAAMPDTEGKFETLFTCYSDLGRDWAGFSLTVSPRAEALTRAFFIPQGLSSGKLVLFTTLFEAFSERPLKSQNLSITLQALEEASTPEAGLRRLPLASFTGTTDSSGVLIANFSQVPSNTRLEALISSPGWKRVLDLTTPPVEGPFKVNLQSGETSGDTQTPLSSMVCRVSTREPEDSAAPAADVTCQLKAGSRVLFTGKTDSQGRITLPIASGQNLTLSLNDRLGQFSQYPLPESRPPFLIALSPLMAPGVGQLTPISIATVYPDGRPAVTRVVHPSGTTTTDSSGCSRLDSLVDSQGEIHFSISDDLGKRWDTQVKLPIFAPGLTLTPESPNRLASSGDKLYFRIRKKLTSARLGMSGSGSGPKASQEGQEPLQPTAGTGKTQPRDRVPSAQGVQSQTSPTLVGILKGDTPIHMALVTGETFEIDTGQCNGVSGPCAVFAMSMDASWPPNPGNGGALIPVYLQRRGLNLSLKPDRESDAFTIRSMSESGKDVLASIFGIWSDTYSAGADDSFMDPAAASWNDPTLLDQGKPDAFTPWSSKLPGTMNGKSSEILFDSTMWRWLQQGIESNWFSGASLLKPLSESRFRFARKLHLSYLFTALLCLVCCCGFLVAMSAAAAAINYRKKGSLERRGQRSGFLSGIPMATILFTLHLLILSMSFHGGTGFLNILLMVITLAGMVKILLPHLDESDPYQPVPAIFAFSAMTALYTATLSSYLASVHGAFCVGPWPWALQHAALLSLAFFPIAFSIFADAISGGGPRAFREVVAGITATVILLIFLYSSDSSFSSIMSRVPKASEGSTQQTALTRPHISVSEQAIPVMAISGLLSAQSPGPQQRITMNRDNDDKARICGDSIGFSGNVPQGRALVFARTPAGAAAAGQIGLRGLPGPRISVAPPIDVLQEKTSNSLIRIENPSSSHLTLTMGVNTLLKDMKGPQIQPWTLLLPPGKSFLLEREISFGSPDMGLMNTWFQFSRGRWNLQSPLKINPSDTALIYSRGLVGRVDNTGWITLTIPEEALGNPVQKSEAPVPVTGRAISLPGPAVNSVGSRRFAIRVHRSLDSYLNSGPFRRGTDLTMLPSEESDQKKGPVSQAGFTGSGPEDFLDAASLVFLDALTGKSPQKGLPWLLSRRAAEIWPRAFNEEARDKGRNSSTSWFTPLVAAILLSSSEETRQLGAALASHAALHLPPLPSTDELRAQGQARRILAEKLLQLHLLSQSALLACGNENRRNAERVLALGRGLYQSAESDTTLILTLLLQRLLRGDLRKNPAPLAGLLSPSRSDGSRGEARLLKRLESGSLISSTDPPGSPWDITFTLQGNPGLSWFGLLMLALPTDPSPEQLWPAAEALMGHINPGGRNAVNPALCLGAAGLARYLRSCSSAGQALTQSDSPWPAVSFNDLPPIRFNPVSADLKGFSALSPINSQTLAQETKTLPQADFNIDDLDFVALTPSFIPGHREVRIGPFPGMAPGSPLVISLEALIPRKPEDNFGPCAPEDHSPLTISRGRVRPGSDWPTGEFTLSFGPAASPSTPRNEVIIAVLPREMVCTGARLQDIAGSRLRNPARGIGPWPSGGQINLHISRNHLSGGVISFSGSMISSAPQGLIEASILNSSKGAWTYLLPIEWLREQNTDQDW